jgi:hypothetical protein
MTGAGKPSVRSAARRDGAASDPRRAAFANYFPRTPVVLPVIPVQAEDQAGRLVQAGRAAGADGAILASAGLGYQKLLRIARVVGEAHPGYFLGVSCRDLRLQDVFCRLPSTIRAVWSEEPLSAGSGPDGLATIQAARLESGWQGLLFGMPAELQAWQTREKLSQAKPRHEVTSQLAPGAPWPDVITLPPPPDPVDAAECFRVLRSVLGLMPLAGVCRPLPDVVGACGLLVDGLLVEIDPAVVDLPGIVAKFKEETARAAVSLL